jgi:geranylgeranyl pyrophosphate synthase
MFIQILDDLEDFHGLQGSSTPIKWMTLKRSLPVVYALQMYSGSNERQLRQYLNDASGDNEAAEEAIALLEGSGVVVYLISEMARHRNQAIENLEQAEPQPEAAEFLETFVSDIGPPM